MRNAECGLRNVAYEHKEGQSFSVAGLGAIFLNRVKSFRHYYNTHHQKGIIRWKTGQLTTPGRRCDDCSIILPGSSIANILLADTAVSSSAMLGMFRSYDGFVDGRPIRCGRRASALRSFDFTAAMFEFFAAATWAWLITPDFGFCNG